MPSCCVLHRCLSTSKIGLNILDTLHTSWHSKRGIGTLIEGTKTHRRVGIAGRIICCGKHCHILHQPADPLFIRSQSIGNGNRRIDAGNRRRSRRLGAIFACIPNNCVGRSARYLRGSSGKRRPRYTLGRITEEIVCSSTLQTPPTARFAQADQFRSSALPAGSPQLRMASRQWQIDWGRESLKL